MHCDINPPQNHPPLFLAKPPKATLPFYVGFSRTTPLKVIIFSELPKYYTFLFLTQSYLLKVTKFLIKISKFHFLVMIEKNIFIYKLFLNISDFSLFFMQKFNPLLKKVSPFFPCNPALKVEVLSVQVFNNFVAGSTPPAEREECTLWQSK